MADLKIVTGASALNFSANPARITDAVRIYDYYAFAYDVASGTETTPARLTGSTGYRIWNGAVKPPNIASPFVDASAGSPFELPFTNSFLPGQLFDAVIAFGVCCDAGYEWYAEYVYGFSNSPDNVRASNTTLSGKRIFWCDINRSRANGATPYPLDAPYPYHFGSAISYPAVDGTYMIQLQFEWKYPAGIRMVFDWLIEYICDDGLTANASWSGVYTYTTTGGFIFDALVPFKVPRLTGASGWYKINVTPREDWLVSLLPHYHHGIRP
jgi:hypothetical protein